MEDWRRCIRLDISEALFEQRLVVDLKKLAEFKDGIIKQIEEFKKIYDSPNNGAEISRLN